MTDIVEHIKFLRQWAADIRESSGQSVDADRLEAISLALSEARAAGRAEGMEEAAQMVEVMLTSAMTGETIVGRMLHKLDADLIRSIATAIRAAKEK